MLQLNYDIHVINEVFKIQYIIATKYLKKLDTCSKNCHMCQVLCQITVIKANRIHHQRVKMWPDLQKPNTMAQA